MRTPILVVIRDGIVDYITVCKDEKEMKKKFREFIEGNDVVPCDRYFEHGYCEFDRENGEECGESVCMEWIETK